MAKKNFRKGINGKSHVSWPGFEKGNNGQFESLLSEPVPEYFSRPGDRTIRGQVDNNAIIILGRDRTGVGERDGGYNHDKGIDETNSRSGYSDYMAAGAIDIVVGRMAPFPISKEGYTLGPLFTTAGSPANPIPDLRKETLTGTSPEGFSAPHPGYAMDAARIYISQMTNLDENFKIESNILKQKSNAIQPSSTPVPYSGIMIKSDQVRMHAREDIKIVTGGPGESRNSQGEPIMQLGGIHLMAQNQSAEQQPIPLGMNLVVCLEDIMSRINQTMTIMLRFAKEQNSFNKTVAEHRHFSPFYGLECTPSITGGPHGIRTVVNQYKYVIEQLYKEMNNVISTRSTYFTPGKDTYINSPYNTTN
tara:strand:+ start:5070 stop:6155 length:1086 start_codon:yes stop_codon:yes gene_type:complete